VFGKPKDTAGSRREQDERKPMPRKALAAALRASQFQESVKATELLQLRLKQRSKPGASWTPALSSIRRDKTRSLLLDPVNPIMHPKAFVHHKMEPGTKSDVSEIESELNSNPYCELTPMLCVSLNKFSYFYLVRMLSSPLRRCILTTAVVPSGPFNVLSSTSPYNSNTSISFQIF
jgi:hypothetical protein